MRKKSESFDGNLVWIQDGVVSWGEDLYFHNKSLDRFVPLKPQLLSHLACKKVDPKKWKIDNQFGSWREDRLIQARRDLCKLYGSEVAETLENGRLQLTFLLNTEGGQLSENFYRIAKLIKSRKGRISAFGSEKVMSAGAHLLMMAPKCRRFIAIFTNLMFHLNGLATSSVSKDDIRHEYRQNVASMKEFEASEEGRRMRRENESIRDKVYKESAEEIIKFLNGDINPEKELSIGLTQEEKEYLESFRNEAGKIPIDKVFEWLKAITEEGEDSENCKSTNAAEEFIYEEEDIYIEEELKNIYKARQEDEIKIRELLLKNAVPKRREEMKHLLDQAFSQTAEPDCPIYFNFDQIQHFGLAKIPNRIFQVKFQEINRVDSSAFKNTKIDTFFDWHKKIQLLKAIFG